MLFICVLFSYPKIHLWLLWFIDVWENARMSEHRDAPHNSIPIVNRRKATRKTFEKPISIVKERECTCTDFHSLFGRIVDTLSRGPWKTERPENSTYRSVVRVETPTPTLAGVAVVRVRSVMCGQRRRSDLSSVPLPFVHAHPRIAFACSCVLPACHLSAVQQTQSLWCVTLATTDTFVCARQYIVYML